MLNNIISFSLRNRFLVLVVALLLLLWGVYVTRNVEVDVFPDLNAPTVVVLTEAHGLAPDEVERMVSFPIETAINGSTGLRRVRSASTEGFSIVWAEFDWSMDNFRARQLISEKLMTVQNLPKGVESPVLAPQSSLLGEVMILAVTSEEHSSMDLRTIADWEIRTRLLSVNGVAQVVVHGGEFKEYQILLDPLRMKYFGVALQEVIEVTNEMNKNASGGFFSEFGNRYIIKGKIRTSDLEELSSVMIKMVNGYPITLKDIADIKIGAAPIIGKGSYNGDEAVIITIAKQPGINTLQLTEDINKVIVQLENDLHEGIHIHDDIFDQSLFIQTSINNVTKALIEGGMLVVLILFIFLFNYRTTVISLIAIPISLLFSVIVLKLMGYTINTMSLGGMAIAIGSLVDDAIIDVENVYKRLRENIRLPKEERKKSLKVIYEGSVEIRASIFNATLIIIAAFVPLFFLSGMEGRMLQPLGISYIVALFASLVVAVTLTPVLCSYMLTNEKRLLKFKRGSWVERNLKVGYEFILKRLMDKRRLVLGSAAFLLTFSIYLFTTFGSSFLPPFNEGTLTINLTTMPGISLEESVKLGKIAEKELLLIPEILSVERKTGRAELAEHSFGPNSSEIDAPFKLEDRSRTQFLSEVRERLNTIPGVNIEVGQPITHRMNHMISGTKASIAIKVFGTDISDMYRIASLIKDEISLIPGVNDVMVEQQVEIPQIKIVPNRMMLAKYGIPINEFSRFIDVAFAGIRVSDVFESERKFDLVLRLKDDYRGNIESIRNAMIDTQDGKKIPLHYVADISSVTGPNKVSRENVKRVITISANESGRDIGSTVADIKSHIKEHIKLPAGYHIEFGGQFENEAVTRKILMFATLLVVIIIYLILYYEFRSFKLTGVILLNLPLAIIGGVFALWITGGVVNIPAIIGFITLLGIATINGILLVSRYEALKKDGSGLLERIIVGSTDRLTPILMTALTAALALIPLAVTGDRPGNEIQSPMAVVILGGLISATLLNLILIPIVYALINKQK